MVNVYFVIDSVRKLLIRTSYFRPVSSASGLRSAVQTEDYDCDYDGTIIDYDRHLSHHS
jgi:hypothetical protein